VATKVPFIDQSQVCKQAHTLPQYQLENQARDCHGNPTRASLAWEYLTPVKFFKICGRIARGSMQAGGLCGRAVLHRKMQEDLSHPCTRRVPCLPAPPTFEMTLATPRRNIFSPGNDDDPWGELEGRVCVRRRQPMGLLAQVSFATEDIGLCRLTRLPIRCRTPFNLSTQIRPQFVAS
jgi:hypothetical protein